ncbi:MAG: tryptophan halogenase family protein [bacterium]
MSGRPVERILIVGGGSSGWMTAALLHKALGAQCAITVVESPAIGRIGVGEATVPSIKAEVFDALGIPEEEWMPACGATYKLGIRFVGWAQPPGSVGDDFYHLFGEIPEVQGVPLTHYWVRKARDGFDVPLARAAYTAAALCDHDRSPRMLDGTMVEHYAYHFDAQRLADFLRDWSKARGVRHVEGTVEAVSLDERGWVSGVKTREGEALAADLYVDCSGFRSLLLGKALGEPFIDFGDSLLCDRAVAAPVPHDNDVASLAPYSTATALSAGWVWRIPLVHRTGNGYVYSSRFTSPEAAEAELRRHLGPKGAAIEPLHLRMEIGRRVRAWVGNVVGIGLAAGFLEPLESTGIYFAYAAVHQLLRHFPDREMDPRLQAGFNERVAFMVDDVRDFIVLHYVTTSREDTAFWRACRHEVAMSESLRATLDLYDAGVPVKRSYSGGRLYEQFDASFDRFWSNSNYTAILCGMKRLPERVMPLLAYRASAVEEAERVFAEIAREGARRVGALPTQRDFLRGRVARW